MLRSKFLIATALSIAMSAGATFAQHHGGGMHHSGGMSIGGGMHHSGGSFSSGTHHLGGGSFSGGIHHNVSPSFQHHSISPGIQHHTLSPGIQHHTGNLGTHHLGGVGNIGGTSTLHHHNGGMGNVGGIHHNNGGIYHNGAINSLSTHHRYHYHGGLYGGIGLGGLYGGGLYGGLGYGYGSRYYRPYYYSPYSYFGNSYYGNSFYRFGIGLPYSYGYNNSYYPSYYSYVNGSPYYCAYGSTYSNWGLNSLPYYTALPATTTSTVVVNAAATTPATDPNAVAPASATSPAPPQPGDPAAAPAPGDEKDSTPLSKEAAKEMYDAAQAAFKQGRYFQAIQKSGKAIESDLENVAMHDFLQQSMFALGDYRSAAIEAHAVLHLGKPTDWQTVAKLYADPAEYTDHLRTLENDVKENPGDPATQFLLGYHYNVLGHKPHAIKHLKKAFELAPKDEQASKLLTDLGEPPANPPAATPPTAPAPPATPPTSI